MRGDFLHPPLLPPALRPKCSTRLARVSVQLVAVVLASAAQCLAADADPSSNLFRLFHRPAAAQPAESQPHPAVVRIIVDEGKALANGSGSLVATRDQYGLVVTNWHVVRDAAGKIEVVFPDGFRSAATILKTDETWDLAALLIWRPSQVTPLQISYDAPRPGEPLTIAGYGQGPYRAVSGKCTQYVAPSTKDPYEIVELSAQARQGDSGGPILNERGELAGVLFGASRGSTSGSFCGRVRLFLATVWPELDSTASQTPAISTPFINFSPPPPEPNPPPNSPTPPTYSYAPDPSPPLIENPPPQSPLVPVDPKPAPTFDYAAAEESLNQTPLQPLGFATSPPLPPLPTTTAPPSNWDQIVGTSTLDRAKSVLALIGLLAVWGHISRLISK